MRGNRIRLWLGITGAAFEVLIVSEQLLLRRTWDELRVEQLDLQALTALCFAFQAYLAYQRIKA